LGVLEAAVAGVRKPIELNEPAARRELPRELRQHLISASNQLYLHEQLCEQHGAEVPEALKRAHRAIKAELKRLESA
jgi:hypothetical protein